MSKARHRRSWAAIFFAWIFLLAGFATAAPLPASPKPNYIRDDAKWLSPGAFQALDEKLKTFEKETSSQIVVATFPKIPDGEELVDFSQRLYEFWKPGLADKDNGALLLFFAEDRKMRIHTGYGMEGVLPDGHSKQIIQDVIAPRMREGNREVAINAGVDAMISAAKGEYVGTGKTQLDEDTGSGGGWLIFAVVSFLVLGMFFPRLFIVADVIFGSFGSVRNSGGGGGWSSGGGGGWSGGGGSSGGGFSGGGGSSGGGGASGDW